VVDVHSLLWICVQDDQFDAENGAEESIPGAAEQPAVSTSGRNLPRMQAVGFEKQRTKRNYEPDQDVSNAGLARQAALSGSMICSKSLSILNTLH
jgi:hypothetical protein